MLPKHSPSPKHSWEFAGAMKDVDKINQRELLIGGNASWHDEYKESPYIHVGNLPHDLNEGDVITVFSQ